MYARRFTAIALTALLVASSVGATAVTGTQQQAYAGTHVSFDTTSDAVVDYAVQDETVLESVAVQSQSKAESSSDVRVGADLSTVTGLAGSGVSVDGTAETHATVKTESGAQLNAHDNSRGILVVESGDESQYVAVNVSESTTVENEGDKRVVLTTEDGTEGTFIVVGDGDLTVNEDGNVTASLEEDSRLVFRAYSDGRQDDDRKQEQLIADGKAAAGVYVMQEAESGGETVVDVVEYSEDTTVEVTEQSEGQVKMTAERSEHEGRVIITSVSDAVIENTDDLSVTVDGEAAAEASSYGELESATNDGDTSKFLVRQQSSAEANAEVLVGVNHFSEREIAMQSGDETSDSDGDDSAASDDTDGSNGDSSVGAPGFGVGVSVVALLSVALLARFRR